MQVCKAVTWDQMNADIPIRKIKISNPRRITAVCASSNICYLLPWLEWDVCF